MAMHHELSWVTPCRPARCCQRGQAGFHRQTGLFNDPNIQKRLRHRTHLDHQTTGPALHEETGLTIISLMQIHRQSERTLHEARQSQISGPTAVNHQTTAHGRRGAVQIEGHPAGMRAVWTMQLHQGPGPGKLQRFTLIRGETFRQKAAVEITVDVPAIGRSRIGIADQRLNREAMGIHQIRRPLPGLQQPWRVHLVAMGPGHKKNVRRRHQGHTLLHD